MSYRHKVLQDSSFFVLYADIDDQGFASKSMGDGIAIELQDGVVVAPFSGTVEVAFPTPATPTALPATTGASC